MVEASEGPERSEASHGASLVGDANGAASKGDLDAPKSDAVASLLGLYFGPEPNPDPDHLPSVMVTIDRSPCVTEKRPPPMEAPGEQGVVFREPTLKQTVSLKPSRDAVVSKKSENQRLFLWTLAGITVALVLIVGTSVYSAYDKLRTPEALAAPAVKVQPR